MLVTGDAENVRFGKDQIMFEFVDQDVIDSATSPRVVNSHLPFRFIPEDVFQKRNKIIHVMRNPKDIAVSSYNHQFNFNTIWKYDGQWDAYLDLFLNGKVGWCYEGGGWFGYIKEWEQAINKHPSHPILTIYYEQLQQNPLETVKEMANFLKVSYDESFCQKILEKCSFQRMKEVKNQFYTEEERALWRDKSPKVFRKGMVGDWKNWFTVAQNEQFDETMQRKMTNSKLKFTFEI